MDEIEKKIVARFRENGDRWFGSLPDWPNTEIGVGDRETISGTWMGPRPRRYHHRLTLSVDRVLSAHSTLGVETIGDTLVVAADVRAERKLDGPVWTVSGMRKYWDQIGWSIATFMRTHDGHFLRNRLMSPQDLREIRKAWRTYQRLVPEGMDWEGDQVVRDPNPTTHALEGARFSHVHRVFDDALILAFVRPPVETTVAVRRMRNGMWMMAETLQLLRHVIERYEEDGGCSEADLPLFEDDPYAGLLAL
ncbi:hypothetical protein GCM10011390_02500 [Aureimonas endophytica]|uniref:Uncharacterized protein n=1 Tax=Aureimonas endophytica TaxID=2027858 RepID=A0A916ZC45_9HYPH|nr:hypothetical protein [Aureimonas endophytica]GGD87283.1 hypothetical protein GCM10011390_02500 [Aureimonas endophytica]